MLTVYGIETDEIPSEDGEDVPDAVATVLTVYGIETYTITHIIVSE